MFNEYLLRQEKPNIDRKDVALMMYQRGLGLLDLALCVDTEVTPRRQRIYDEREYHDNICRARDQLGRRPGRCRPRWARREDTWSPGYTP